MRYHSRIDATVSPVARRQARPQRKPLDGRPPVAAIARASGNRTALAYLAATARPGHDVVMREYKANAKQKNQLTRAVTERWEKTLKKYGISVADAVNEVIGWCNSHSQALNIVSKLSYDDFLNGGEPDQIERKLIGIKGEKAEVAIDPTVRARQAIKQAGHAEKDFSADEIKTIIAAAQQPDVGWSKAVTQVWDLKEQKRISDELAAERVAKYSTTKSEGDIAFSNEPELVRKVWSAGYGVATASSANKNAEIGGSYPDQQIIAAANIWHHHQPVGKVANFHVPGHPNRTIEDKSKRLVNPDPTRGRQADFIAAWDGGDINIHVNSEQVH